MSNHAFSLHSLSAEFNRFHNVVAALPADKCHSGIMRMRCRLDSNFHAVTEKMKMVTDRRELGHAGDFKVGDRTLMTAPRQAIAWMLFLDAIHHRGQLSTQIRPMGGKVPSIYGPSADTAMGG